MGYSPTGEVFNLSCEEVATRAAVALGAEKLIICGSDTGLMDVGGTLVRQLKVSDAQPHLERLREHYVGRLLKAAVQACQGVLTDVTWSAIARMEQFWTSYLLEMGLELWSLNSNSKRCEKPPSMMSVVFYS